MGFIINPYTFTDAFAPDDETGLWMWLEADSIGGLSDGDPVSTWADSGGGAHDATAAGSARPTWETNVINGLPVVRFNGTANIMDLEDASALTSGEAFFVFNCPADPPSTGTGVLYNFGSAADTSHHPFGDGNVYDEFGTTSRKTAGNPATSFTSFVIYNVWSATNDWASSVNGSSLHSTGTNTVGFPAAPKLGGSGLGSWGAFDVATVIVYDHKLSSGARSDVVTYLENKYAL